MSLPTGSLGLQSIIACICFPIGVFQLCKAIKENIQLGAGEKGGGTGGTYMCGFVFRVCLWSRCVKAVGREDMIVYSSRVRGVIAAEMYHPTMMSSKLEETGVC